MKEVIEQDYEQKKQKTMYASWIKLKLSCEGKGIPAPSYKTFTVPPEAETARTKERLLARAVLF
jgi:hypothetical protein